MSRYVTPFLVLNLGAEMVYVVAQRLQAQNVTEERARIGTKRKLIFLQQSSARCTGQIGATFEPFAQR